MILTLSKNLFHTFSPAILLLSFLFLPINGVYAQGSLSLSVSPTLFEMSANPGQLWQSSIKVINSNPFELTVYAQVVNFAPQGETGQGKFIPVFEEMTEGSTLAEWVDIKSDAIYIPPEKSQEIPFIVEVPEDASPGGHFAAIMISTSPPAGNKTVSAVRTTQVVTSLFFVRVAGDVNESGTIRSFSPIKSLVQTPNASFALRFENKGNVHLQPRGDIRIYNMWGTERGIIPINHSTHFGNVLPESIRKFEFSWTGEQSITDIGRYKAIASLAYGLGETKFTTSTAYFWVIPIKSLLITFGFVFAFALLISWAIKLYIRRMLQLAGVPVDARLSDDRIVVAEEGDVRISAYSSLTAPVRSGYLDLRTRLENAPALFDTIKAFLGFLFNYKLFFAISIIVVLGLFMIFEYVSDAINDDKSYDITISNPSANLNLTSEEIVYNNFVAELGLPPLGYAEAQTYELRVVNTSGEAGVAATTAADLAKAGYEIAGISTEAGRLNKTTAVVFDAELQTEALEISRTLDGALPSVRTSSSTKPLNITIFVGADQIPN